MLECDKEHEKFYANNGFTRYFETITYKYKNLLHNSIAENPALTKKVVNPLIYNFYTEKFSQQFANHMLHIIEDDETRFLAIYVHEELSFALLTPYLDGYKLIINSNNHEDIKSLFNGLCASCKVGINLYIELSKLESELIKFCTTLEIEEISRKSNMYNKVL